MASSKSKRQIDRMTSSRSLTKVSDDGGAERVLKKEKSTV